MSVYVKNMEMPKEGEYHMTLYVCSDGSAYIDVASFPVDEDRFEAIPVPPHGRLIDADVLAEKHTKLAYELRGANYDFHTYELRGANCNFHMTACAWVNSSPTIIPASEEARNG